MRFAAAYEAGSVDGIASLFTPDAEVNEGRGTTLIRRNYGDFFSSTSKRRIEIGSIDWQSKTERSITGTGGLKVFVKHGAFSPWRTHEGTIRFELTQDQHGLRIVRMFHRL
jgi:hypothetical protein